MSAQLRTLISLTRGRSAATPSRIEKLDVGSGYPRYSERIGWTSTVPPCAAGFLAAQAAASARSLHSRTK